MTITQRTNLKTSLDNILSLLETIGGTKTGKKLATHWAGKIALFLAATAATATPAHALRINATYSSEMDLETTEIINDAVAIWEEEVKDPVTLNINFSFDSALPTGVLGGSKPAMMTVKYKDYLTALGQDTLSDEDIIAVQSKLLDPEDQALFTKFLNGEIERKKFKVKETKTLDVFIDETFVPETSSGNGNGVIDNNGNNNNQKIWLTRGNGKALGFIKGDDKKLDANIVLSSVVNWDMNPDDGISPDAYDFQTVVLHEIGHALGFVSGADAMEFISMSSTGTITDDDLSYITPMNTYTYSEESAASGVIDLRLGQGIEKYVSLDEGVTKLTNSQGDTALLSTGGLSLGGDGYQTSHWKDAATPLGIMNPTLNKGETIPISVLDRTFLDVMGWDLVNRTRQLMEETGLNWDAFQVALENHKEDVVAYNDNIWASYNPDDENTINEELKAELEDLYKDIEPDIQEELLKLKEDLANEDDPIKRDEDRVQTMEKIWDLIEHQDDELKHFTDDVRDVNVKVREWLDKDVDQLADLLRDANRVQIHKLQRRLKRGSEEEQLIWENKIRQALALFLSNPDTALKQITDTNDFHNPMGGGSGGDGGDSGDGGSGGWWGGWWSSSVTEEEELELYNYSTSSVPADAAQPAQSVPEPSAIIGLVALGGIGFLTRQRRN